MAQNVLLALLGGLAGAVLSQIVVVFLYLSDQRQTQERHLLTAYTSVIAAHMKLAERTRDFRLNLIQSKDEQVQPLIDAYLRSAYLASDEIYAAAIPIRISDKDVDRANLALELYRSPRLAVAPLQEKSVELATALRSGGDSDVARMCADIEAAADQMVDQLLADHFRVVKLVAERFSITPTIDSMFAVPQDHR